MSIDIAIQIMQPFSFISLWHVAIVTMDFSLFFKIDGIVHGLGQVFFGISNTLNTVKDSYLDNSLLLFHESFWKFCFYFHQIIWCQSSALDYWHSIFSVQSITNPLIESVMNNIFHDLWCSLMSLSITVIRQAMLWSLMTPIQNVIITVIRIICANLIIIHVIVSINYLEINK